MATVVLGDIVTNIKEVVNPKTCGLDKFVGLEHYDTGEPMITRYGTPESLDTNVKHFCKGDILVARRNVYLKRAGYVDFEGVTSGDSIVLRVTNPAYQRILPFILNTDDFWDYAEQNADGTMSKRLSPDDLLDYEFEEPEEKDILAEKLWAAYLLKESYRQLLATTDDMVKAKFQEMFDFKRNPNKWKVMKFSEFATIDCDMTTDFDKYASYPHIGVESIERETGVLFGYKTVAEDHVISGKYIFTPRHIIYSKIRPYLNKVALPDFDGLCSADAYPILPKDNIANRIFLASLMRSTYFLEFIIPYSLRTGMPKVNREQLLEFECPFPPIDIQNAFEQIYLKAEKTKASLRQSIESISRVMHSLINQ